MDLTFIKFVSIRGMWMLNSCLFDYFPRGKTTPGQELMEVLTSPATAYDAVSELFPDNHYSQFEFIYAYAFLDSRYGETVGYKVTESALQAEYELLEKYYSKVISLERYLERYNDATVLFDALKKRCLKIIPQFK